jgi:hypothetical protein
LHAFVNPLLNSLHVCNIEAYTSKKIYFRSTFQLKKTNIPFDLEHQILVDLEDEKNKSKIYLQKPVCRYLLWPSINYKKSYRNVFTLDVNRVIDNKDGFQG